MSARYVLMRLLGVAALLIVALVPQAWGKDLIDQIDTPFDDPLWTRPPVLDAGVILPGDDSPVPCPAHKDFAQPLTLSEAVDIALCNNPQVQVAWAAIKVQAAAMGEARAAFLPTLSGSVSRLNDHTSYPGSTRNPTTLNNSTAYGTLSWRLFDFGGRNANRESANALLDAALSNHEAALQKTLLAVISAYFDAQTAMAAWTTKEQNEVLVRRTLDAVARRESKGAGAQTDTLQATTALAKATLERSRAYGVYQKALSVLVYSMGMSAGTHLVLAEDLSDSTQTYSKELSVWLEQAQHHHPAIAAVKSQLIAAQQKVRATRSEGLPVIDTTANFYQNGRPNQGISPTKTQETTLGISLNMPIFDGFSRTYKVRGAEALVAQREAELIETEHQILIEIVKTHADAVAALANLTASESFLLSAEKLLASVQRKFDKGAADILEVLNTQTVLADAQNERIRCLAEWRSARFRLFANAGMMGRQILQP